MQEALHTNSLIHESSPYLLQHAHNPVDWHPWGEAALFKASSEDKLLLVSIGYAACHWCHVMEKESFEDEEVAQIMNELYVCIKVDREERPDVDHYFMTAVQLSGAQGGWPLNVVALPDGKPIWGGTYFPRENWINALRELNRLYREQRADTVMYAENLSNGIRQASLHVERGADAPATPELIRNAVEKWKHYFDRKHGGRKGHPKFPMPVNLEFLMHYAHRTNDPEISEYLDLTLAKMAMGGIYDQAGGGFARYSTDELWKVPHFEKMLYDNGQLISVFSKAWQKSGHPLYKTAIYETIAWIQREMMHPDGAFYSSLDADSEGVEGKFYTWKSEELKEIAGDDLPLFSEYFNLNKNGYWEDGQYILLRTQSDEEFASKNRLSREILEQKVASWKSRLLEHRDHRTRPALDDKILTSWNALVLQGLCDAYKAFGETTFLILALNNALFLKNQLMLPEGSLFHTWKDGRSAIPGFLEDYAQIIQAYISLYEVTGDESWTFLARKLMTYTEEHFFDPKQDLFFFSRKDQDEVIINHYPVEDNVVASSNSVMALNLFRMSRLFSEQRLEDLSQKMGRNIAPNFSVWPHAHANWGRLLLLLTGDPKEVAVSGGNALSWTAELQKHYMPDLIFAPATTDSSLPILKNRYVQDKTLIYVCAGGSCRLPVESPSEALKLL